MPNLTRITRFSAGLLLLLSFSASNLHAQQLDPAFHPPVFSPVAGLTEPMLHKVLRQADGRYLVSGNFQSVDGHPTNGMARLLPDGHVDTSFTCWPAATAGTYRVLAVQADGKLLITGNGTANKGSLLRLLPSGQLDAAFRPALLAGPSLSRFDELLVQPDGKLLLAGVLTDSLGRSGLVRLLPSGRVDASFTASFPAANFYTSAVLEPNGRILFATSTFTVPTGVTTVTRLLPSGRVDSSLAYTVPPPTPNIHISHMARCPDGSYAIGGVMGSTLAVGRLLPSGALDSSFPFSLSCSPISIGFNITNPVAGLAVQADGRILACGSFNDFQGQTPLLRTQAQGNPDPTWNPNFFYRPISVGGLVYNNARVTDLLLEPGGKLLVAGQFSQAGGLAHYGLARLLAATPLAAHSGTSAFQAMVWPVPAHEQLQVQLPNPTATQQLALLDVTGRVVLSQQPNGAVTSLNTAALAAGLYVLRVRNFDGSATTQRVVLH